MSRISRIVAAGALAALLAGPSLAQIPLPPLPNLEVHVTTGHPPAPRHEHRSASPGPDYVWVGGFYHWQEGRWAWIPGRWELPERNASWVKPRYIHESGAYRYEPGHWSNQRLEEGKDYRDWQERHHRDSDHNRDGQEHDRNHQ